MIKDELTAQNIIQYFSDDNRTETPIYGETHFSKMEPMPEDLEKFCNGLTGLYIFRGCNELFWDKIFRLKQKYGFKVLWEIRADVATKDNLNRIIPLLHHVDIFSINKSEAATLFNCSSDINRLRETIVQNTNCFVFLRAGADGSYVIQGDLFQFIPSIKSIEVVDPTGGGNSSSAAVLIGFCQGKSAYEIGLMGNISAAYCIKQYGIPEEIDGKLLIELKESAFQMIRSTEVK